ncbi:hypothetical protein OPT61_g3892 [Boeremia exigua]|uniref:Uncharacterized protein n=1 Tax=Boeremia exigua TaxID=749465 RepID=A0ACC2IG41_9PLEO|nr:hypothetical protein OPT61_g3892 [Boeremia exigua]
MPDQLPQHFAVEFVAKASSQELARQLRNDIELINKEQPCSWVALYAPSSTTNEATEIAQYLTPSPDFSKRIKLMLYESFVTRITQRLNDDGIYATNSKMDTTSGKLQTDRETCYQPSSQQIHATLGLLSTLISRAVIDSSSPLDKTMSLLRKMAAEEEGPLTSDSADSRTPVKPKVSIPSPRNVTRKRLCYICRMLLEVPHPSQPAMCIPCGSFNLASSQISTPSHLTLPATFTALVTGARINLGYHTTLRLLRCGARVLATTRYPRDAVVRYAQEGDYHLWKHRLRIVGADFRCAADVFALVRNARRCLQGWAGAETLHLLINNAAQTLTDSVSKEKRAIERETALHEEVRALEIMPLDDYRPQVRGGGLLMALGGVDGERGQLENGNVDVSAEPAATSEQTV